MSCSLKSEDPWICAIEYQLNLSHWIVKVKRDGKNIKSTVQEFSKGNVE